MWPTSAGLVTRHQKHIKYLRPWEHCTWLNIFYELVVYLNYLHTSVHCSVRPSTMRYFMFLVQHRFCVPLDFVMEISLVWPKFSPDSISPLQKCHFLVKIVVCNIIFVCQKQTFTSLLKINAVCCILLSSIHCKYCLLSIDSRSQCLFVGDFEITVLMVRS